MIRLAKSLGFELEPKVKKAERFFYCLQKNYMAHNVIHLAIIAISFVGIIFSKILFIGICKDFFFAIIVLQSCLYLMTYNLPYLRQRVDFLENEIKKSKILIEKLDSCNQKIEQLTLQIEPLHSKISIFQSANKDIAKVVEMVIAARMESEIMQKKLDAMTGMMQLNSTNLESSKQKIEHSSNMLSQGVDNLSKLSTKIELLIMNLQKRDSQMDRN